jgi:hypothetical protein
MNIEEMKKQSHDEEEELLIAMGSAKLASAWAEIAVGRRALRNLNPDEGDQIALSVFENNVAELAVEFGNTREEFLRSMGEAFDAAMEDAEPDPDETIVPS